NKMLVKQKLVNRIKDYFELNIYETKVWLALLGKGVASAGQIAEISRVPRSRTYDVLESLEKKGFAIVKLGKPMKYIGVKPQAVLEKMKNNVKQDARERIVTLSNLKKTDEFSKIEDLYNQGIDPVKKEEVSAALKGKSNISNYLKDILQNATEEVIICTNAEDVLSKLSLFKQTIEILKKRGINTRIALSGNSDLINKINKKLGMEIKNVEIKAKFFIIDKKEMLFYISDNKENKGDDIAVWINSEFFVDSFSELFDKALKSTGKN
ncbi:MAG: helix-turn-helix domain-containing protein, partial [Candidatus Pacearchaeota archaeon]